MIQNEIFQFRTLLHEAQKILIVLSSDSDEDEIAGALALYLLLTKRGKQADIVSSKKIKVEEAYLYGIDSNSFRLMIGLGIIFLIPDFIKTLKEALGIKELPFNIGVGTYFGGVATGVGGVTGVLGQFGSLALAVNYLPGGKKLLAKISGDKENPLSEPRTVGGLTPPIINKG